MKIDNQKCLIRRSLEATEELRRLAESAPEDPQGQPRSDSEASGDFGADLKAVGAQSALHEEDDQNNRRRRFDSEFSTPKKFSWDYGADLGVDENQGQFISTRRDLTLSGERRQVPSAGVGFTPNRPKSADEIWQRMYSSHDRSATLTNRHSSPTDRYTLTWDRKSPNASTFTHPTERTWDASMVSDTPMDMSARSDSFISGQKSAHPVRGSRSAPEGRGHHLDIDATALRGDVVDVAPEPRGLGTGLREATKGTVVVQDVAETKNASDRGHASPEKTKDDERKGEGITDRITGLMERESPQRQVPQNCHFASNCSFLPTSTHSLR